MTSWRKAVVLAGTISVAAAPLLSGCADYSGAEQARAVRQPHRQSPAPVEAPVMPAGTFDRPSEQLELAAAKGSQQGGDLAAARASAEAAVGHWPGDAAAWAELESICEAQHDASCRNNAAFFRAKVEFVGTLPARAGALGFQNIAEEEPGATLGNITLDEANLAMARRLWAFYAQHDPMTASLESPAAQEETFSEKYPYAPMLIVGGVVGGVLTGIKSVAK